MENLIANIMTYPDEARAMFDILRQLVGEAENDRFENLMGGVALLESDTVRVVLTMLVSVTDPQTVEDAEANFMKEIHPGV